MKSKNKLWEKCNTVENEDVSGSSSLECKNDDQLVNHWKTPAEGGRDHSNIPLCHELKKSFEQKEKKTANRKKKKQTRRGPGAQVAGNLHVVVISLWFGMFPADEDEDEDSDLDDVEDFDDRNFDFEGETQQSVEIRTFPKKRKMKNCLMTFLHGNERRKNEEVFLDVQLKKNVISEKKREGM